MKMLVDGAWVPSAGDRWLDVRNPATGEVIDRVPHGTEEDIGAAVDAAGHAFDRWSAVPPRERGKRLFFAAQEIRKRADEIARLLTREQGKPLAEAHNEVLGAAHVLEYYASISGTLTGTSATIPGNGYAAVVKKPLGVCGAIIPWNMPVLIPAWKLGPMLLAGNTVVLKPSQSTPLAALQIALLVQDAVGVPGALNVVTGTGSEAGEALVRHPAIRHVSFTGQTETGKRIAMLASGGLKTVTLELGGSDPMIVCADADLDAAVEGAVRGRFYNCGQTCTAVKRLYVDAAIAGPFCDRLTKRVCALRVGDGLAPGTDMGPLHREEERARLLHLLAEMRATGDGRLAAGGDVPDDPGLRNGHFLTPTLVTDMSPDSALVREEIFGPVLPVTIVTGIDEAIALANRTRYGLGASVWTRHLPTAARAAEELECGIFWVNQHLRIPPDVPFGGVGESGIGRENGPDAPGRYMRTQTILMKP
ncbi:MAG: aldehyde dehydrogenase [Methanomicrobiaceae archaeon]|nr:aldehyde dehydrogenase [Methanomicrobiaceae archaeon]